MNPRLNAKLHIPEPGRQAIPRPRCIGLLQRESHRPLLTLAAPAGYGKTVLLGEWAHALATRAAVGWLTLDREDNLQQHLLAHFIAALPLNEEDVRHRLQQQAAEIELGTTSQDFPQPFLDAIIQSLAQPDEVHLFFDQYEIIEAAVIHRIFEYLITYSGKHVHYYIASRVKPAFSPAIQRLHPGPLEISREHLKLDMAEMKAWTQRHTRLRPQTEWLRQLESRTEGWPLVLETFASLRESDPSTPASEAAALDAVEARLQRILSDEWLQQPEPLRRFMLLTSISDTFNEELGFRLSEDEEYLHHIGQLLDHCLLFQEANQQFRYHPILVRFMRERLKLVDTSGYQTAQDRAVSWYEEKGRLIDAIRQALQVPDFERASGLLLQDVAATFSCPKPMLIRLLEQYPGHEISGRPSIAMIYAWFLTAEHRISTAEAVLDQAEMQMTADFCPFPPTGEDLRGYTASIRSRIHFLRRETEAGTACMKETEARLNGPGYLYSHLNTIDPAGSSLLKSDAGHWGSIDQILAMCEYGEAAWKGVNQGYGVIHILLGECHYERHQLDKAEEHLLKGRRIGLDLSDMGLILPASLALAELKHQRGEHRAAQILLQETGQLLAADEAGENARAVIDACRIRLDIRAGRAAPVRRWLRNRSAIKENALEFRYMYEYLTLLRAQIFLKQSGPGIIFGEKLLSFSQSWYLHCYITESSLLLAVLYECGEERNKALNQLENALTAGEREGYIELFLTEWDIAQPVLLKYGKWQNSKDKTPSPEASRFYDELVQHQAERELAANPFQYAQRQLTAKEYKVLQYLIAGKSNADIAKLESISIETTKTHCRSIYKKLRIKSRKEVMRRYAEYRVSEAGIRKADFSRG